MTETKSNHGKVVAEFNDTFVYFKKKDEHQADDMTVLLKYML